MSWCGRCFTVQTSSDFESEDDGEYEYFVNSRYICKRKKSVDSSTPNARLAEASSSMSHTGTSETSESTLQNPSSARSRSKLGPGCMQKEEDQSTFDTSDKNSSVASSQLKDARVWQVAHATINCTGGQCVQPFFDTSNSDSDRTLEIVFDTPRREAKGPLQETPSPDNPLKICKASSLATTATSMVTIDHSPITTHKKRRGFIQRLFGRSEKPNPLKEYDVNGMQSSLFKESMELSVPAETTKTLYWTVRVKLK